MTLAVGEIDVYVSYAAEELDWAEWVREELQLIGLVVAMDDADWARGDDFLDWLNATLGRAQTVVALWSRAYFADGSYARQELARADAMGVAVVPFRVGPVDPPNRWRGRAAGDLFSANEDLARRRLLSVLTARPSAPPVPFPALRSPSVTGSPSADVFISYSREDRAYVERLVAQLTSQGISVWWDRRIRSGEPFATTIQRAIDGCTVFVLVLTPASANAEWVRRELSRAARLGKPIRPLLLEPCDRPIEAEGLHYEKVVGGLMPSAAFVEQLRAA